MFFISNVIFIFNTQKKVSKTLLVSAFTLPPTHSYNHTHTHTQHANTQVFNNYWHKFIFSFVIFFFRLFVFCMVLSQLCCFMCIRLLTPCGGVGSWFCSSNFNVLINSKTSSSSTLLLSSLFYFIFFFVLLYFNCITKTTKQTVAYPNMLSKKKKKKKET